MTVDEEQRLWQHGRPELVEDAPLPIHESATCPMCGWAGVVIRGEECLCFGEGCGYRWRWPLTVGLD